MTQKAIGENVIDPSASDWSDLDLLTIAEARERLVAEITATNQEIAQADPNTQSITALRRRLASLQERLSS